MLTSSAALDRLRAIPALDLWTPPSPLHELTRLREALGGGPRLFIKRDDAIPFGFGGNKVRKIALVAARAISEGADTLLSVGGGPGRAGTSGDTAARGERPERSTVWEGLRRAARFLMGGTLFRRRPLPATPVGLPGS